MCMIMIKPPNVKLPSDDLFVRCWNKNPDGFGYMYADNNKLHVMKGLMKCDEVIAHMNDMRDFNGTIVAHWRLGTNGAKIPDNTHPFFVNENVAMVHNGIISKLAANKAISDSKLFAELSSEFDVYKPAHCNMLQMYIGSYNKVVYLNNKGKTSVLNKQSFIHDKDSGCIFSNHGFVAREMFAEPMIITTDFPSSKYLDDVIKEITNETNRKITRANFPRKNNL